MSKQTITISALGFMFFFCVVMFFGLESSLFWNLGFGGWVLSFAVWLISFLSEVKKGELR